MRTMRIHMNWFNRIKDWKNIYMKCRESTERKIQKNKSSNGLQKGNGRSVKGQLKVIWRSVSHKGQKIARIHENGRARDRITTDYWRKTRARPDRKLKEIQPHRGERLELENNYEREWKWDLYKGRWYVVNGLITKSETTMRWNILITSQFFLP